VCPRQCLPWFWYVPTAQGSNLRGCPSQNPKALHPPTPHPPCPLPLPAMCPQVPLRRPDGDVELVDAGVGFRLAACSACGSELLKPDVVFFGDSVPKDRVNR